MAKVKKHRQSPPSKDLVIISVLSFLNTTHTHTNISWSSWWSCLLTHRETWRNRKRKISLTSYHHITQPSSICTLALCLLSCPECELWVSYVRQIPPPVHQVVSSHLFKVVTPAILSVQIFFQFTPPDAFSTSPILLFDSLTWINRLPCPLAPDCFGQWEELGCPGKD